MNTIAKKYSHYYKETTFITSALIAVLLLSLSLVANYAAGTYATERASNSVTDVILSNIPVFDVDGLLIFGTLFSFIGIGILMLVEPRWLPFTLKGIAVFTLVRSIFITLTHIGPFPDQVILQNFIVNKFVFGGDLFFSGHTGLPFLLALFFWDYKYFRYILILISLFFATLVLLGHLHYSIDVFAAYFITFSIFHICRAVFPKDYLLFKHGLAHAAHLPDFFLSFAPAPKTRA